MDPATLAPIFQYDLIYVAESYEDNISKLAAPKMNNYFFLTTLKDIWKIIFHEVNSNLERESNPSYFTIFWHSSNILWTFKVEILENLLLILDYPNMDIHKEGKAWIPIGSFKDLFNPHWLIFSTSKKFGD